MRLVFQKQASKFQKALWVLLGRMQEERGSEGPRPRHGQVPVRLPDSPHTVGSGSVSS